MTKTVRDHLEDLPEPYRTQALQNMWWEDADSKYQDKRKALYQAFNWSNTDQGYNYWREIYDRL